MKGCPIEPLLESLSYLLQEWFVKHINDARATFTILTTKQEKKLRENSVESKKMKVSTSSSILYHVNDGYASYLVNMEERTCTCNYFQVDKIPCAHALAVIAKIKEDSYSYCSVFYTTNMYIQTYSASIFPLGDHNEWNVPDEVRARIILAPNPKRKSGQPKEKRIPSKGEKTQSAKCGRCGNYGHNRRSCQNPPKVKRNHKRKGS
ncbi:uncharacterized protein LOC111404142 [Olea europaea var. sylvestris]|uniref:uncharacterized protein LOC111404142 n=1 Tax=Olea europaea var. sylvestris TaxID=158386 RepID=UPI000C1D47D5|nr:uncharacterized protein LOC111404142 [Olea europaea var. sylvestris]